MPGAGTRTETRITANSPPARLLDLTRLVARAGRLPTGVDRVERAYLRACLAAPAPVFGLVRTPFGYLLLDEAGCAGIARLTGQADWGEADALSRLARRRDAFSRAGQARARGLARARCLPPGLARTLRRHLPPGTAYLNIGHSNLTKRVVTAVRSVPNARIAVFVHDTIPLDAPLTQREGSVERFAAFLHRAAAEADLILCNSEVTRAAILRHAPECPPILPAHLGVEPAVPDPAALPAGLPPAAPYFVALGTIEPRKGHALLLDVWDGLGAGRPELVICGRRGWRNEAVFARLDRGVAGVRELPGLSDGAVAALLAGARALLFPSLAEGFGLPPVEAAALGTPVVCGDLAICREVLGDVPIYADPGDVYAWRNVVERLSEQAPDNRPGPVAPPDWNDHFERVFAAT